MSKFTMGLDFCTDWIGNERMCKEVARNFSALPINLSDPFTYARTITELQHGYVLLSQLQAVVNDSLKHLSTKERFSLNDRVQFDTA